MIRPASNWDDWEGRLHHPDLPLPAIIWFARHGFPFEREDVASNRGIPADIALELSEDEDQDVLESLARNSSVPTEILELLVSSGRVDASVVAENINAAIYRKLDTTLELHGPSSLSLFLDSVRASEEERLGVWAAAESKKRRQLTLREVWKQVRTGPSAPDAASD